MVIFFQNAHSSHTWYHTITITWNRATNINALNKQITAITMKIQRCLPKRQQAIPQAHADKDKGALQWRHNGRHSVSNHQLHGCLLNCLFTRRSKKTTNLRLTGLCAGNSPLTGEFPAQMASNVENASIWWCHHGLTPYGTIMSQVFQ